MATRPLVTVVVPNLNSAYVDRTLRSVREQRYDLSLVEVLVVGLDAPGLVQEDRLVRFISTGTPASPARARNIGISQATGEILCFLDADCWATENWLSRLTNPLLAGTADVVGGGVMYEVTGYWSLCDNVSWFHDVSVTRPSGPRLLLPTLNLGVLRRVVDRVGVLDERFPRPAGEDSEWTTRMRLAGHELRFLPDAVVVHHPRRSSVVDCCRHAYYYGRYSIKANRDLFAALGTPWYLRHPLALLGLSPAISLGAAARVYHDLGDWVRFWYALPGIWLTKVAWCIGAAVQLGFDGRRGRC